MFDKIKKIWRKRVVFNDEEVELSIKLTEEEKKEIKKKYGFFIMTISTLGSFAFLFSLFITFLYKDNTYFLLIYGLSSILVFFRSNLENYKKLSVLVLLSVPFLFTSMVCFYLIMISKTIFIFKKEMEDGHIIKVNLNLQEFSYKHGLLSSDKFEMAEKLEKIKPNMKTRNGHTRYVGNYYYRGVKCIESDEKILTEKEYQDFKKEIDKKFLKQKINKF
jgi:hypothetical protein